MLKRILFPVMVLLLVFAGPGISAAAEHDGIAAKRPVIGGACPGCPWGALADQVKAAMAPLGYDVQVCYVCGTLESTRIVAERRVPKAPPGAPPSPPLPTAPVDFGVVELDFFTDAYHGTGLYEGDAAKSNLRLLARLENPSWFLVATRAGAFITDLKQVRERRLPVKIIVDHTKKSQDVLRYYGIQKEELESWGGDILPENSPDRERADVIIHFGNIGNVPESNLWHQLSQRGDLRFIALADDLLADLSHRYDWEVGLTPVGLLKGMDRPVKTLRTSGTVVYGRADLPDQFAYDVARALDQSKRRLVWSVLPFSYNPDTVARARDVPLHPGAARYYRERGYLRGNPPLLPHEIESQSSQRDQRISQ